MTREKEERSQLMESNPQPRTWRDHVRRNLHRWRKEIRIGVLLVAIFLAAFAVYADEAPATAHSIVSHLQHPLGVCP